MVVWWNKNFVLGLWFEDKVQEGKNGGDGGSVIKGVSRKGRAVEE